jgi:hypothetical protein
MPPRKRKLPVDKTSRNLNDRMDSADRKRRKTVQRGKKKFSVLFDGKGIERAVCQQINRDDTHYVVGCIAWLSNKKILKNLATKRGVCIVCTRDKLTRAHSNQEAYKKLKPAFEGGAIRIVGDGKGWHKSTMHHKFLIGLDGTGKPLWCTNGSFNMTTHALSNLENLMVIDDADIADVFLDEFRRVHGISKPLRYRRK